MTRLREPMPGHKICSMCWQDKAASEFYARKVGVINGVLCGILLSYCKPCHKARTTAMRQDSAAIKLREKLYAREWRLTVRVQQVLDLLCREYGLEREAILGKSREPEVVEPRQMACYLLHCHYRLGVTAIGRALGLDHSTVLHNVAAIRDHATPEEAYMVVELTYQLRALNNARRGISRPARPHNPLPAATPDPEPSRTWAGRKS